MGRASRRDEQFLNGNCYNGFIFAVKAKGMYACMYVCITKCFNI